MSRISLAVAVAGMGYSFLGCKTTNETKGQFLGCAIQEEPRFEKRVLFEGGRFPNRVATKGGSVVATRGQTQVAPCIRARNFSAYDKISYRSL